MPDPAWHKRTREWVDGNVFPETRRGPTLERLNKMVGEIVAAEVRRATRKRPEPVSTPVRKPGGWPMPEPVARRGSRAQ